MTTFRFAAVAIALMLCQSFSFAAPGNLRDQLVFIWAGQVYAQSIGGSDLRVIGTPYAGMRDTLPNELLPDIYDIAHSLLEPDSDDFGFFHGVWSVDRTQFIYLTIGNGHRGYRIERWQAGESEILFSRWAMDENGYLDPIGFTSAGNLLLIERAKLHQIDSIRVWRYAVDTEELTEYTFHAGELTGGSVLLPDSSTAFLGYETTTKQGHLLNLNTAEITTFAMPLPDADEPKSIFELYPAPFMTLGVVPEAEFNIFLQRLTYGISNYRNVARPAPFLHWPLADDIRTITCYPDSNWTAATFAFTCPGFASPQNYDGHQGTDVGGRPVGLPIGTNVYPALPGVVVKVIDTCDIDNPSCGSAYGNIVMLEHTVSLNGNATTWFTGYAHLSEPFVGVNDVILDITQPIAASGATGVGGAHLHFEVRHLTLYGHNRWVDPWGAFSPPHEQSLWIGGNEQPESALPLNNKN